MCEVLAPIGETSPSPDEDNSRMEQLMISMLEEREKLLDKLRDSQDACHSSNMRLAQVEADNAVLLRQLHTFLPNKEDREKLHSLLLELKENDGQVNGHPMEDLQQWPIAAEILSLARELNAMKESVMEKEEEVTELKAERANMKLLLEHLECLVSRHERSLRVTVLKRQTANSGVSSEVEVLKALKSLFDHHKALDEKVRERLKAANERNLLLEEELLLANQEIKSLHDEARRNKRLMAQRNSFRMSANYDNVGFTQEQLLMLQEKDQTISDLQFSLDERTAELEDTTTYRDELSERLQDTEDELEIALRDLHATQTELTKVQQSIETSTLQHEAATHAQALLTETRDKLHQVELENQQLVNQISLLDNKLLTQREESQELKSELNQKENYIRQSKVSSDAQLKEQTEQLSKAEEKQGSFETRILELEALCETKNQEIALAKEKERINDEHIERLQSTVERMLKESNQRLKTHFAEKKALMEEKTLMSDQLAAITSQVTSKQQENASLKEQLEQLKKELTLSRQKLEDLQRITNRHSKVTDLDVAKTEWSKRRSIHDVADSNSEVGGLDKGSWDFSEPGAVSHLMSMLQGQVSTLDQQLGSLDVVPKRESASKKLKPLNVSHDPSHDLSHDLSQDSAPPPGSPPPPSPMRVPLRKSLSDVIPNSMYRVTPPTDLPYDISGGNAYHFTSSSSPHHKPKPLYKTSSPKSSVYRTPSIGSSVKKVFRRRSTGANGAKKSQKRNSAPSGLPTVASLEGGEGGERSSLDLSLLGTDYEDSSDVTLVEEALLKNVPFAEWQKSIIMCWLQVWVGLPDWYISALKDTINNGTMLESVTDMELCQEYGITNPLHRMKLRLAIMEVLSVTQSMAKTVPQYGGMDHCWISDYWLPSLGLAQYSDIFKVCLVDARMLEHLTKKDLRTLLKMLDSSHRNSLQYGITVLKKLNYDRNELERRRLEISGNTDVITWTNDHVMRWVELVGLGEYTSNLSDSGIHGGVIALDNDFNVESLALVLKIPQSHQEARRILKTEFTSLLSEGTKRGSTESQTHGKIVRRISKRLKVGRRVPSASDIVHIRAASPVLLPIASSKSPPISEHSSSSTLGSQEFDPQDDLKEMTV